MGLAFGKYELLAPLGAGGMGEVFVARERGASGFERVVALKRLLPHLARDEQFVALFTREATVAAQLSHANIVHVYEFGQIDGHLYIAMEYVQGGDLRAILRAAEKSGRPLGPALACHIGVEIAAALEYAHARRGPRGSPLRLVHRDVSPHNVFLSIAGEVKLGDFGVAHVQSAASTAGMRGKIAYMSPEQASGDAVDARTDLFALGLVLAEILSGRRWYEGLAEMEMLERARRGTIPALDGLGEDLPASLRAVLVRALAPDHEARFQTAREMRLALADELRAQGTSGSIGVALADAVASLLPDARPGALAATATVPARLPAMRRARRRAGAWIAVVAVAGIAGIGLAATQLAPPPRRARVVTPAARPPSQSRTLTAEAHDGGIADAAAAERRAVRARATRRRPRSRAARDLPESVSRDLAVDPFGPGGR